MPKKGAASHADYLRYRQYYLKRESSPEGIHKRELRAEARAAEIKAGHLHGEHDPRTVDHVKPLSKGGTDATGNLRIVSATANREKYNH
jgi:hypothetical protein